MNDNIFLIFGYIGSANACIMMIPQLFLTFKEKSMKDISIYTISLNLLTQFLFLPYTLYFELYPFLTVNIFLTVYDITLISYYLYLKKKEKENDLFTFLMDTEEP